MSSIALVRGLAEFKIGAGTPAPIQIPDQWRRSRRAKAKRAHAKSSAVTSTIKSGRLAGLLETRDSNLPDLAAALDAIANTIRDQINTVHNQGTGFPPANVPFWAVAVAFGFSAFVGILFGIIPAAKAANLDPIDALRYE